MQSSRDIVNTARELGIAIPAFNAPYLPMMEPIVRAAVETDAFAFVEVARVEWMKFEARSTRAALEEYRRWSHPDHVRLHLDHVPMLERYAREAQTDALLSVLSDIDHTLRQATRHLNLQMALENILFRLRDAIMTSAPQPTL